MTYTLRSADRATHLKILAMATASAVAVALVGPERRRFWKRCNGRPSARFRHGSQGWKACDFCCAQRNDDSLNG